MGKENFYVIRLRKWALGFLISGLTILLIGIAAILIPDIGYRPVFGLVSSLLGLSALTHLMKLFVLSVIEVPNNKLKEKGIEMNSSKSLKYWSLSLLSVGVVLFLAPTLSYSLMSVPLPFVDLAGVFGPSLIFLGLLGHLLRLASSAIGETLGKKS